MMGLIRRLLLYRTHELRLCHSGWDILTEICHVRVDEISASTVEMAHSRGRKKLAAHFLLQLNASPVAISLQRLGADPHRGRDRVRPLLIWDAGSTRSRQRVNCGRSDNDKGGDEQFQCRAVPPCSPPYLVLRIKSASIRQAECTSGMLYQAYLSVTSNQDSFLLSQKLCSSNAMQWLIDKFHTGRKFG